jgi:hypothetical protein
MQILALIILYVCILFVIDCFGDSLKYDKPFKKIALDKLDNYQSKTKVLNSLLATLIKPLEEKIKNSFFKKHIKKG